MEDVGEHPHREGWILQDLAQSRDYLSYKRLLVEFIEYFGDAIKELRFLALVFLMDVLEVADSLKQWILEPWVLDLLAEAAT